MPLTQLKNIASELSFLYVFRKGQVTNEVLFGGGSLGAEGVKTLDEMKKTADKGIKID